MVYGRCICSIHNIVFMRFIKPQTSGFNHCRAARRGCRAPLWLRAAQKRGAAISSKRGPARPTPTDVAIAPTPWIEGEDFGEQNMGKPVINHGMWGWSWLVFSKKSLGKQGIFFIPMLLSWLCGVSTDGTWMAGEVFRPWVDFDQDSFSLRKAIGSNRIN